VTANCWKNCSGAQFKYGLAEEGRPELAGDRAGNGPQVGGELLSLEAVVVAGPRQIDSITGFTWRTVMKGSISAA